MNRWIQIFGLTLLQQAAGTAFADCVFPNAVEITEPLPRWAYAHLADAAEGGPGPEANALLHDMLTMAGEYKVWEFTILNGRKLRCIHADTAATCSNGIVTCQHFITDERMSIVPLAVAAHRLELAGDNAQDWPDILSTIRGNEGTKTERFVYDIDRYWPAVNETD